VLIFNGDILSGVDLVALVDAHRTRRADVTLHLTRVPREKLSAFGLVPTDADGWVTAFREKPQRAEDIVTDQINAGCYVFRRSVIDGIPAGRRVSVERETFPGACSRRAPRCSAWSSSPTGATWARRRPSCTARPTWCSARSSRPPFPPPHGPTSRTAWCSPAANSPADVKVGGGSTIGAGARVASGAEVHGSVIGEGARIDAGAIVRDSIVGCGAAVGAGTVIEAVVVGDGATLGARNELRAGARVWCDAVIGDGAVRFSADES